MRTILAVISMTLALSAMSPRQQVASSAITAGELRTRLEAFSHDSMEGRRTGTRGSERAMRYLVAELTRLGITPAGTNGEYFQPVPLHRTQLDMSHATMKLNGPLRPGVDFLPITSGAGLSLPQHASAPYGPRYLFGGRLGAPDAIKPSETNGRLVVFFAPRRTNGQPDYQLWNSRAALATYTSAAALFVATLDLTPRSVILEMQAERFELRQQVTSLPRIPPLISVTQAVAEKAFAGDGFDHGILGEITFETRDVLLDPPARNVIAIVEGSDPRLKSEYVVLSAHADHLGIARDDEVAQGDSIFNGADDGGTGSIALLAIAQHLASLPQKPKRSILFVWTTAEEDGLLGSEFFTDNPVVPRDSIVANITVDMIGRGGAKDIAGGGPSYVQMRGAGLLSSEFGEWLRAVNGRSALGLVLDAGPAPESAQALETCSGDEWHFTRWGIPGVRITTGRHADYHRATDDVTRIDFDKYTRVTRLVAALVQDIADRPARPRVDKSRPDPRKACAR
jgi:hypothetical protein